MRVSILSFSYQIDISSTVIQTKYSIPLTVNRPTYSPSDCEVLNYYYEAIQMNVVVAGHYTFSVRNSVNAYFDIYKNKFDPFNPYENFHSRDDRQCSNGQNRSVTHLQVNTTYVLVVRTNSLNATTGFSIIVSGPNNVRLNRISKCLHCFVNNMCGNGKLLVVSTFQSIHKKAKHFHDSVKNSIWTTSYWTV